MTTNVSTLHVWDSSAKELPSVASEQLKALMTKYGFSQNMLSAKIGISTSVLSQILAETYPYIQDNFVWMQVRKFIEKASSPIYETKLLKVVHNTLNRTFEEKEISCITGASGAGKTTAIENYCLINPNALYIRVNQVMTRKYLLISLLKSIGQPVEGYTLFELFEIFSESLARKNRIIIVDEAERLDVPNLELLRDIYDQHNCGLALIGLESLRILLKKGKSLKDNLVQLYSRIGYQEVVDILTPADIKLVFDDRLPGHKISDELIKRLSKSYQRHGGFRAVIKLANLSIKLAEKNDVKAIDDNLIEFTISELTI